MLIAVMAHSMLSAQFAGIQNNQEQPLPAEASNLHRPTHFYRSILPLMLKPARRRSGCGALCAKCNVAVEWKTQL